MEALVGLLLIGVCYAVETSCDGRQDGAECVGALGGAVNIQLMDDALDIDRFQWKKGDLFLINWKNKTYIKSEGNKSLLIPSNGTVRINNLNRNDSGKYKLHTFDSDGLQSGHRTLQLSLQAPVSSVQLVSECLSQGQMNVSCSSEGDSPQFSWTLDGHTLTDSELLSGNNQTNVIVLRQNISGRLVCSVRNQVSKSSSQKDISSCFIFINCTSNGTLISEWVFRENNTLCDRTELNKTPNQAVNHGPSWYIKRWSVMVGALSVLVFALVVGTTALCVKRKKQRIKVEKDDQELIYSDVNIVQQQKKRQVKNSVEEEVENEQVRFSVRPCQSETAADDCLYTQVHRGRRSDVFQLKQDELQKSVLERKYSKKKIYIKSLEPCLI